MSASQPLATPPPTITRTDFWHRSKTPIFRLSFLAPHKKYGYKPNSLLLAQDFGTDPYPFTIITSLPAFGFFLQLGQLDKMF